VTAYASRKIWTAPAERSVDGALDVALQPCTRTENTCWTYGSEGGTLNQSAIVAALCRRTPKLDEAIYESFGDGLRAGVDLEVFVDVADMEVDGVHRDAEFDGGGFVDV